MTELLMSTLAGFIIGAIFTAIKLPIPAPPVLSGCVAILGVWGGHQIMLQITERFFS
ncbi:XapX domain-containing protein [Pseudovibrio denitrificans]|uniref:XapX domain-containing protein n=2 Tax=Pseudovibrio TaxID=258255 RepID=A0A1I7C1E5_9HYPH|nr:MULTISPECIES: DUF1427 family protein [Pseudovibrio]EEA92499.1 conserved hypothetical protein [Pseudovibrio sp. JE062]QUS56738.1 DUF1427 family protein [Pseudovibrio brasiliensis]SFT93224.1 XapX domain-containing protein [Pseudovibrio denitrificans]